MEVRFTPEQEARLHLLASRTGKDPEQVVEESVDRMLEYDEHFLAAVEEASRFENRLGRPKAYSTKNVRFREN